MKWKLIKKNNTTTITNWENRKVKELLREEADTQCVYCALSEHVLGGSRGFAVEHYRPKCKFPHLANDYQNLFYSCLICNSFKGSDWPGDPMNDNPVPSYPNPLEINYNDIFEIDWVSGIIKGKCQASIYVERRIFLNRPHLILERKRAHLDKELADLNGLAVILKDRLIKENDKKGNDYLAKMLNISIDINNLFVKLKETPPYETGDLRR